MSRALLGLYGAGGFAREVMPIARATAARIARDAGADTLDLAFLETDPELAEANAIEVMSEAAFLSQTGRRRLFNVAIASSPDRQRLAEHLMAQDCRPANLIAPTAHIDDGNCIGEGAILCANTIVTSNAVIGRFFHANIYSYVAHDCVIGDFVTFAPRVSCNGNVSIGDHAYIGTGAILRPGSPGKPLRIGEGAVIGMGAVVTKDVPPHTTVVGSPAKPLIKPAP